MLTRESQARGVWVGQCQGGYRCVSDAAGSAPRRNMLRLQKFFRSHQFCTIQNEIFAFLKGGHCHICAAPILHVFVPIRGVHVIRGEVQTCWPRVPTLLSVENCSYSPPTEVTFQYLPPSIFWLEENASYHFSNLVT